MSSAVLCGRGNLPKLVLLREVVCMTPGCPRALWESCRPLEWFWCYWGWSLRRHAPIRCERVVRLLLNIPARFQGDRSRRRRHMVIGMRGWVRGMVEAHASPLHQSGGPLLHCVRLLALSHRWVHICTCCHACSASLVLNKSTPKIYDPKLWLRAKPGQSWLLSRALGSPIIFESRSPLEPGQSWGFQAELGRHNTICRSLILDHIRSWANPCAAICWRVH